MQLEIRTAVVLDVHGCIRRPAHRLYCQLKVLLCPWRDHGQAQVGRFSFICRSARYRRYKGTCKYPSPALIVISYGPIRPLRPQGSWRPSQSSTTAESVLYITGHSWQKSSWGRTSCRRLSGGTRCSKRGSKATTGWRATTRRPWPYSPHPTTATVTGTEEPWCELR